jgi:hypothetical protein
MSMWVLVTSAGSGASGNLVRSLRAGCAGLTIVGCHDDQFILKNSTADRNYLVPPLAHPIARSEISTTPGSQTVFAVDLKEDSRHTTIRVAATPKSARTRALLAQFKKGVRAIEKKWKAHAAAAKKRAAKAGRRRRR